MRCVLASCRLGEGSFSDCLRIEGKLGGVVGMGVMETESERQEMPSAFNCTGAGPIASLYFKIPVAIIMALGIKQ